MEMEIKLFNFEDKEESIVCYYQDGNFLHI